jgi:tRNA threonylcarbamoyladenosine biosynthesis protein TsaB
MILLALEASSAVESAALLEGGRVLGARAWPGDRVHARPLFESLRDMLKELALPPARIDAFAVGLGPGSFAGLRMALSCVQGLALPGEKTVFGLSSAEAAACQVSAETGLSRIFVCGDGRRGRAWSGWFEKQGEVFEQPGAWRLDPLADLASLIPEQAAVCTAQFDVLAEPLRQAVRLTGARLVERSVYPSAETVAGQALLRMERGLPSLPLSPIYLHPPVFIPPSFIEPDEGPSQEPV